MTTAPRRLSPSPGSVILARSTVALAAAALLVVSVAGLVAGGDAAGRALLGGAATAVVLAFGSWSVHVVASAMPSASLLVALMTYGLQVAAMTAFMALVTDSPEWEKTVLAGWLVAAVVVVVLVWIVCQVVLGMRARIPLYDLPARVRGQVTK
jgi:ATP synthase protein I